jgi:hypothetical protein
LKGDFFKIFWQGEEVWRVEGFDLDLKVFVEIGSFHYFSWRVFGLRYQK